jgi:thiol-disulfide isomerase/thioredoxin
VNRIGDPKRLAGALVALAIGLAVLWQAGVFDSPGKAETTDDGQTVQLEPADVSVETAPVSGRSVGLREGDVAPDFEFSALDGTRMRLSDYRGRPVFLNFWASWCGPCRAEMPTMETKLREYADDGLVVLGMNNGERVKTAQRFLNKLDVQLTAFGYDPAADVSVRYSIPGMPTSFFIDADGVITGVFAIEMNAETMDAAIAQAIAGYGAPVD